MLLLPVEILVVSKRAAYLFSLTSLRWKGGPALPEPLDLLESFQLDDGFMVIGGHDEENESQAVNAIITIDSNYQWLTYREALEEPKYYSIGINVPEEFFDC